MVKPKLIFMAAGFGLATSIFGIILGWGLFPYAVNKKVGQNIMIVEGTEQYERFIDVPQPVLFKVYLFNITNPDEVQEGAIPIVKEVGPYVYKQYRKKSIREFSKNGTTVTFTQQQTYVFDEELSGSHRQLDKVVVLNMPLNAFLQVFERDLKEILSGFLMKFSKNIDRAPVLRILRRILDRIRGKRRSMLQIAENDPGLSLLMAQIDANLKHVFNSPTSMFITTTVDNYLFNGIRFCNNVTGIARIICRQIKEKSSKTIRSLDDGSLAFSFFNHKNTTHDGIYEVFTGADDPKETLQIYKWNEDKTIQIWMNTPGRKVSICNMINGTDGSGFRPYQNPGGSLFIFSSDICRSVQLDYHSQIKYNGIPGYRYSVGRNFLSQIGPEYSNECFCSGSSKLMNVVKKKNGCLYAGALDLSPCMDAPVIMTLPHLLGVAQEYKKLVKGLSPDAEKHDMFLDVNHLTGYPLQGGKRVQFNMFLKPINKISLTEKLTTSLVPTVWIEEGIALNEKMVNQMKSKLINILTILDATYWTMVSVGVVILVAAIGFYFLQKRTNKVET